MPNQMVEDYPCNAVFNQMVEHMELHLDAVLYALADPTRRAMLHRLAEGESSVCELALPFDMSLNVASKHIEVLESAGLIRREVRGRTHLCWL